MFTIFKLLPKLPLVGFFSQLPEIWHEIKPGIVDVLPSASVDHSSDWKSWAFYLRGAVPMNPEETQTPSEEKD